MKLTPEQGDAVRAILRSSDESFLHLLRVAGLDPARVIKGADLRRVVFTERDDLAGLDMTGCDLRGADLTRASGKNLAIFDDVITDANTRGLPQAPSDFDIDLAHAMILQGQTPPLEWRPFVVELNFKALRNYEALVVNQQGAPTRGQTLRPSAIDSGQVFRFTSNQATVRITQHVNGLNFLDRGEGHRELVPSKPRNDERDLINYFMKAPLSGEQSDFRNKPPGVSPRGPMDRVASFEPSILIHSGAKIARDHNVKLRDIEPVRKSVCGA